MGKGGGKARIAEGVLGLVFRSRGTTSVWGGRDGGL